jgi:cyanophycin synthetase
VGKRRLHAGHCANHANGQRVLLNREVQAAIIENGCEQILTEGLAYERCEVGIITHIDWQEDLSAYEISDEAERINLYRTQMDVVLPSGMAVLNADDLRVVELSQYCDGKVTLFSKTCALPELNAHIAAGHRGVFIDHGQLILSAGPVRRHLCHMGALSFLEPHLYPEHTDSVLAAAAAAWALGVSPELIEAGLIAFNQNAIF